MVPFLFPYADTELEKWCGRSISKTTGMEIMVEGDDSPVFRRESRTMCFEPAGRPWTMHASTRQRTASV